MIRALRSLLRRRKGAGGDGLPADRRQGEGAQERVLRAFRVPARSGHSEFADSLDLTPAEADEWPEGTDPPAWAEERINERWWSWVNSMTTRPPASEQVNRIRRIGRRWWRASSVASRRSQPPGTRHTRAKRKAVELPNQVHREVPLDRRRFPVKLPADHFAAACSCGMVVMGATDEAREKWAAHLGRDVPKAGRVQRAARRVLARLRSWRDSARRPVDATARAVQIARETSPTDLADIARLLADARISGRRGPPTTFFNRLRQRLLDRPSFDEAAAQGLVLHPEFGRPTGDRLSAAVERDEDVVRFVTRLLRRRGPSTVARLVVPAAVDAVKAVLRSRLRPHVGKERLERVPPAVADRDPSGTVEAIHRAGLVVAARLHVLPRHVLRRFVSASAEAMNEVAGGLAPAAPQVSAADVARPHLLGTPAVASDDGVRLPVDSPALARPGNGQQAEGLSHDRLRLKSAFLAECRARLLRSAAVGTRRLRNRHPVQFSREGVFLFHDPELRRMAEAARLVDATMVTITANTGSGNWNVGATWVGGVQPTAANDVVIPASSTVTIASATTALCRSCTVQTSGTLAFAATTSNLNIGDGTAGAGNVAFSCSGTVTLTAIGTINFVSTSATQQTILSASTMPNVTFSGAGGSWLQSNALAATGATITLTAGTWATGGLSVSASVLNLGNATARTWTPGASTITVSAAVNGFTLTASTNLVVTPNTAVLVLASAGGGSAWGNGAGFNFQGLSVVVSGTTSAVVTLNPNGATIANLVIVATAAKTGACNLGTNLTVTGTVAFQGNSPTNRLLVQASVLGTQRTITDTGASWTASVTLAGTAYQTANVDLMDIKSSTGTIDLSAITGNSGDAQGNTGITFTSPATQTNTGATGTWSDVTKWTSRVPLPQDNVVINTGSGTITADMPRLGKDLTFTGFTGLWSPSISYQFFGNWTFGSGMTTSGPGNASTLGRGTQTLTNNGVAWPASITFLNPVGSYALNDALKAGPTGGANCNHQGALFNSNGFTITCQQMIGAGSGTTTITNSTINITLIVTASFWSASGTQTINTSGSTFVLVNPSSSTRTFGGAGKTYGTLQYTVSSSPGPLVVTGANTFANITVTTAGNAPKTLTLPSSTITTVTGTLTLTGTQVSGYVYLPGLGGSYSNTPSNVAFDISGDIDIRVLVAMDNWIPASDSSLICRDNGSTGNRVFNFYVQSSGKLVLLWSPDGTVVNQKVMVTTVTTGLAAGAQSWVRVTRVASTGVATFYTSPDGTTWTQLGATVSSSTGSLLTGSGQNMNVGANITNGTGNIAAGKFYKAQVLNGINGAAVASPDFTTTATGLETSYTDAQANIWTVNGAVNSNVYLNSSTGGTQATVATPGATWQSVVAKDINTTPAQAVYALDSIGKTGNNNTGIVFCPPDVTPQDRAPQSGRTGPSRAAQRAAAW